MSYKTAIIYFFFCLIIGLATYNNALFNGFFSDDFIQILQIDYVKSVRNIPLFFTSALKVNNFDLFFLNSYYKPVMFLVYAILFSLSRGEAFIFHLFQLIIHILNAFLVFLLFRKVISERLSFLLAIIFLVHPANEETVAYIAALQDTLFFFFGMLAVHLLLGVSKTHSIIGSILFPVFLLLSLFSKESGILFVAISLLVLVTFIKSHKKAFLCSIFFALSFYSVFRFIASQNNLAFVIRTPVMEASLEERLFYAPRIFFVILREMFVPSRAVTPEELLSTKTLGTLEFLSTCLFILLFFLFFVILGKMIWDRRREKFYFYLLFFVWLIFGIGIHLQIIPLDVSIAKRWFYFPMVGMLGLVGLFIETLIMKRILIWCLVFVGIVFIAVCVYQTILLNSIWNIPSASY